MTRKEKMYKNHRNTFLFKINQVANISSYSVQINK